MKPTLFWLLLVGLCQVASGQTAMAVPSTDGGKAVYTEAQEYYFGLGRPYDPQKAFLLYQQAAAAGNAAAMNALANMYAGGITVPENLVTAFRWYEKAGQAGEALAYHNLAQFYRRGAVPIAQDFEKAAAYYRKGANLGNDLCKLSLAYFYFKGLGITQNYAKAFALYKELAGKGDINAQYFTGLCYRNGYGVAVNEGLAREWLAKAASRNDRQALHELNEEVFPENTSIIDPSLPQKVAALRAFKEEVVASQANDIGGTYKGYAVYFDFSKQYVHDLVPLTLTLEKKGNVYEGTWTENDTLQATVTASFIDNQLQFDSNSRYTRHNYYSYRAPEPYQFNSARLELKYLKDSMVLSGDVQFYSILRREPGQPVFIILRRKVSENTGDVNYFKLRLSPSPATSVVQAAFTLSQASKVQLELWSIDGKRLQQLAEKSLPAGVYTHTLAVDRLAAGVYIVRMQAGKKVQDQKFIKH